MSHLKKQKHIEVPLKIDGSVRYIKGVTRYTTCGDVIKMVLKKMEFGKENSNSESFGIFESSQGIERLLPGKNRLSKVMRSWGSNGADFEFVFRKVNPVISIPKISEAKRRKLNQRPRGVSGHTSAPVFTECERSDRNENTRAACVNHSQKRYNCIENNEFVKEIYFGTTENDFASRCGCTPVAGSITFRDAADESNRLLSVSQVEMSRNITGQSESSMVHNKAMTTSINVNNVKYAVRKTLKSKTLSTSNVCSSNLTDDNLKHCPIEKKSNSAYTVISPVHSTPCLRTCKRVTKETGRHKELACAITSKIAHMNQRAGKEALLQKYFADYITYQSPGYRSRATRYRERGDGAESENDDTKFRQGDGSEYVSMFSSKRQTRNQTALADDLSDTSDSGQEDVVSNFDTAFIDENMRTADDTDHLTKLVDYSISEHEDSICSDPSIIRACSEVPSNISSVSDIVRNIFDENSDTNEDDEMESFMKTKLYDEFSDEGLSSMESDHDGEKEFIV